MTRAGALAAVLITLTSAAGAQEQPADTQARAAQLVTFAKLAPLLCPWIEADDAAVRALLDHAGITEHDVMDPKAYGVQDELLARDFAQARRDTGDQACVDVFGPLGDGGAGLLRRKPGGAN